MRKNFKKAAFSVALAMGAVGQVAAPLANPIVALAAENADLQSALVTSGNITIDQVDANGYNNDAWIVNGDSVSYSSGSYEYGDWSTVTLYKMPCLKLTVPEGTGRTLTFTVGDISGSNPFTVAMGTYDISGFYSESDSTYRTFSSAGTYSIPLEDGVTEVYMFVGSMTDHTENTEACSLTLSGISVTGAGESEAEKSFQEALVSSESGNVTVEQYAAGSYSNNTWTVNEDSVTYVSDRFRSGSVWYNKMPCLKLTVDAGFAKTLSFDMSNHSWGQINVRFNSMDDNSELSAKTDGSYSVEIPADVTEVYLAMGNGDKDTSQAEFTLSNLSVDYDETKDYYEIGEGFQVRIKDGVMTVDGTGEFDAQNKAGTGDGFGIPGISSDVLATVKKIVFSEGITGITTLYGTMDNASFNEWCPNVEEVVLPESLETIGSYVFRGCSNLSSVNFPASLQEIDNRAFSGTSLTSVIIPDGQAVKIYQKAFLSCTGLKEVYLGDKVTFLSTEAFSGCSNIEKITINTETFGSNYTAGTYGSTNYQFNGMGSDTAEGTEIILGDSIPETITTVWFENLGKIKSITIPDHVTQIGDITADNPDVESDVVVAQDVAGEVIIDAPQLFLDNTTWLSSNITPVFLDDSTTSDSASISADSFTVKVGEAIDLEATVSGDMSDYKWIIGNADTNETEAVASIDEYGTVTGLKAGYAIVGIVNADNELLDQKSVVVIPAEYDSYDSWISGGGPLLSVGGQTVTPGGDYGYGFSGYTGGGSNSISGTVSGSITGGSSAGGSTGGSEGSGSEGSGSGSEGGSGSGSGSEGSGSTGSNQNDMCITGYITPITEMDVTIPLDGFKFHIDENRDLIPTISNLENNSQFPLDVNALNINGSTGTEPNVIAADTYTQYEWDNMNKRNTLANMALYLNGEELYSVFQNDNLDTSKAINIGRLESGFSGTTQLEVTPGAQYGKNFGNKTETLTFVYDLVLEFEVPLA